MVRRTNGFKVRVCRMFSSQTFCPLEHELHSFPNSGAVTRLASETPELTEH